MADKKKPNAMSQGIQEAETCAGAMDVPEETTEKTQSTGAAETANGDSFESHERADVEHKLAEAERKLTAENEKYMRLLAEYDNYRKRTQKERETFYAETAANVAEKFLPVYDNLERALGQQTEDTAYYKGVELIRDGLLEVFAKLDIRRIEAQGCPFDPAMHNAVMHVEDDSGEENVIAEVFQDGFTMGDRVIRHVLVKVKN